MQNSPKKSTLSSAFASIKTLFLRCFRSKEEIKNEKRREETNEEKQARRKARNKALNKVIKEENEAYKQRQIEDYKKLQEYQKNRAAQRQRQGTTSVEIVALTNVVEVSSTVVDKIFTNTAGSTNRKNSRTSEDVEMKNSTECCDVESENTQDSTYISDPEDDKPLCTIKESPTKNRDSRIPELNLNSIPKPMSSDNSPKSNRSISSVKLSGRGVVVDIDTWC
jgi:hypothetical protein